MIKRNGLELTTGVVALILTAAAMVLFCLSYTTGYYIYGQMQSILITVLLASALVVGLAAIILRAKLPGALWPKFLVFVTVGVLAAAAGLLLGDRVEGIGNCIITDYDSGHGGEEAIYMSLASCILMLAAVIYLIIGSFAKDKTEASSKGGTTARWAGFGVSAVAVLLAVLIPTYNLAWAGGLAGPGGQGGTGKGAGTYTVSFNMNNGNAETMPSYQFLGADFSGIVKADSRLYVDVTLTLDESGGYTLTSDSYVVESGERCEIGDDTGLGQVVTITAEGTYTSNDDGTVTTSAPTHAVFEMEFDTYSAQMKDAVGLNVNGKTDEGVYDSNDEPAVLEFVPETTWTLSEGTIVSYRDANSGGTFTVSYNQGNGNSEEMPDYQFLCSDLSGMVKADSRMYIDITLTLDGTNYTLAVDSYVVESGKRAEIGDDTGLGLILTTNATGTYTENADGTITTAPATHAVFEMETDTYSAQMKEAAGMNVNGSTEDGVYDSNDEPAVLEFVPETIWTLSDGAIVSYKNANGSGEDEPGPAESLVVTSDDGATTMTFNADGTYVFAFEAYSIEDAGTYTYESGVLTLTDVNGKTTTAEGDPLKFHYVFSQSDQLTGDFTVPVADLEALLAGGDDQPVLTVASDDGATAFTFNADGTYIFAFEAYGIEDAGSYTYVDGTLTITDANGKEVVVGGNPLKFHYVFSQNDQLTGDFTVNAAELDAMLTGSAAPAGESVTVTSDDGNTTFTFNADGTYVFAFEAYGIEDPGTFTYENGVLTITNSAGAEVTADGDPLKFHYVSGINEQLTGDFTVAAGDVPDGAAGNVFSSDDGATTITFNEDGTYVFAFEAYGIEDPGTYTWADGTLSITNSGGTEFTATGDPLKFHYVSGVSDQLTGDFTIPAADMP